jgi:uncharacterized protein (DUF924 family)
MHCESLPGQIAAKGMYEGLALRCSDGDSKSKKFADGSVEFAQQHMNVIARFERFSTKDKALGRKSTVEEVAWLKNVDARDAQGLS